MWKYCSHLETAGGRAWILSMACILAGFHPNIPGLLCRPKRCGSGGLETADASVCIVICRRCLLASPAMHAGIHVDDLEYQESTEKRKKKAASLEVTEHNRECRAWWTAWSEVFTDSIILARCKPHPHAHMHWSKLSFVYLWKTNLRKTSLLLYHLQIWAPRKPHICCEPLFTCQTSLKNGSKTTSKRWRLVSAEK